MTDSGFSERINRGGTSIFCMSSLGVLAEMTISLAVGFMNPSSTPLSNRRSKQS